jgi:uncharacterized membrane protein YbaN (DUF454 family)
MPTTSSVTKSKGARRTLLMVSGTTCVALAAVGVVVPGMPTTVFLIAASWLYARSCPGLQRKLLESRFFGPYLRRVAEGRGMPVRAKIVALAGMWGGIVLSLVALANAPVAVPALVVLLGLTGSAVVLFGVKTDRPVPAS